MEYNKEKMLDCRGELNRSLYPLLNHMEITIVESNARTQSKFSNTIMCILWTYAGKKFVKGRRLPLWTAYSMVRIIDALMGKKWEYHTGSWWYTRKWPLRKLRAARSLRKVWIAAQKAEILDGEDRIVSILRYHPTASMLTNNYI